MYSAILYLAFFAVLELFPAAVLRIFDASDFMLSIGRPALRVLAVAYFISIPNLVFAAALQGLSQGTRSMILTMARQAILPVLFAAILSRFGHLNLISGWRSCWPRSRAFPLRCASGVRREDCTAERAKYSPRSRG